MSTHAISRRQILAGAAFMMPAAAVSVLTPSTAYASGEEGDEDDFAADVVAVHEIQARFHHSVSGGGHIEELMSLWAARATFTVGSTTLHGKNQIRAFFLSSGGFTHNWVSVSPTFKTRVHVRGDLADLYFECHFVDWQANPQIVLTHGTFEGTARKIDDRWLFWHVTAGVNPLTP
jgi:hypothetical protein